MTLALAVAAGCVSGAGRDEKPQAGRQGLTTPIPLGPEFSVAANSGVASFGNVRHAAIATSGEVHLVAWMDGEGHILATRIRATDGTILDTTSFPVTAQWSLSSRPAVAFGGGVFLVAWADYHQVEAARVRADGTALDRSPVTIIRGRNFEQASVSADGSNFLVVWGDGRDVGHPTFSSPQQAVDIYAARVRGTDGVVLDPGGFPVASTEYVEKYPATVFDGTNHVVAWTSQQSAMSLQAVRIRPTDRSIVDAPPLVISASYADRPALAFNGKHVVAVWVHGGSELAARRINPTDGTFADSSFRTLYGGADGTSFGPAVAHDGQRLALLWRGRQGDAGGLLTAQVEDTWSSVGSPTILDDRPGSFPWETNHGIAAAAGRVYAVWNRDEGARDPSGRTLRTVQGVRIDPTTGPAGPRNLLSRTAPHQSKPVISFDGRDHLVVWQEWDGSRFQIRGARVGDGDGALRDREGFDLRPGSEHQIGPITAANANQHLVLWLEQSQLRGRRVRAADGAILESDVAVPASSAAVATDGEDFLIASTLPAAENLAQISVLRIRGADGRAIDPSPVMLVPPTAVVGTVSVAYVQSHYVVTWIHGEASGARTLRAVRLTRDGAVVDPVLLVRSYDNSGGHTTVTAMGDIATVTVSAGEGEAQRIRVSDFRLLDERPIPLTVMYAHAGRHAAFDGEHLLKVGKTRFSHDIRLQRLAPDGTLLDTEAVTVAAADRFYPGETALSASPTRRTLLVYQLFDESRGAQRLRFRWLGPPHEQSPPDAASMPDAAPVPPDATVPIDLADPIDGPNAVDAGPATDAHPDALGDLGSPDAGDGPRDAVSDPADPECSCDLGGRARAPRAIWPLLVMALLAGARHRRRASGAVRRQFQARPH